MFFFLLRHSKRQSNSYFFIFFSFKTEEKPSLSLPRKKKPRSVSCSYRNDSILYRANYNFSYCSIGNIAVLLSRKRSPVLEILPFYLWMINTTLKCAQKRNKMRQMAKNKNKPCIVFSSHSESKRPYLFMYLFDYFGLALALTLTSRENGLAPQTSFVSQPLCERGLTR